MLSFIAKAAFAGLTVALISLIARRHPGWGGLLAALPLTSLLAFVILWIDTHDRGKVADLSTGILAFILPSVPFFVLFPILLRAGMPFWAAFAIGIVALLALYAGTFWLGPRLGLKL